MAEQNPKNEPIALDEVNKDNEELKEKVSQGQKWLVWIMIILSVIAVVVIIYIFAIRNPKSQAATEAVSKADIELTQGNDSTALALYQEAAEKGYDGGNRAALMAATLLYKDGKYQDAINQLKNFDPKEEVVGAAAKSLEGDCYVNLQQYPQALSCYDKAISVSNDNPLYTPLFMMKKATVLREQKDYAAELKVLQSVKKDYPQYTNAYRLDIDKYIARAEYQASAAK